MAKKKETIEAENAEALARTKVENIEADKEQFKILMAAVKSIQVPDFKSDDGIQFKADITDALAIVRQGIVKAANKMVTP